MSKINSLQARPILDSRGFWTLEVMLTTEHGVVRTGVPSGKSRGSQEAVVKPIPEAVEVINEIIAPKLLGFSVLDQSSLDDDLLSLDGTENKEHLGGNCLLGVSQAVLKAGALVSRQPLWLYVKNLLMADSPENTPEIPRLLVNMINGGVHSGGGPGFQEYLFIPESDELGQSVTDSVNTYHELGRLLKDNYGPGSVNLGDEGGFAPAGLDILSPFELIRQAAGDRSFGLGVDAAGNELPEPVSVEFYLQAVKKESLSVIEDPFSEDDIDNFVRLNRSLPENAFVVGDDITVTNASRIQQVASLGAIGGVIIKPNQVGTVTETLAAVKLAKDLGLRVIVSHRSGETGDDLIADLACGLGVYGIKLGAPARGERVAKYNRLLEIGQEMLITGPGNR